MFIGHWAPALAVAAKRNKPGLGTLFVAAQLIDWAFFGFLLIGVEHMRVSPGISAMNPMDLYSMPFTHSAVGALAWGAAFGLLVWLVLRDSAAAMLAALVVFSHWLFDLLVHVPDLTLAGNPPKFGFGLWNYPALEMPLEIGLTFGALGWYVRTRRPAMVRVIALSVVLLALQAINWFGPVAPEVTPGTSYLAFFAYGLATLAAWWMGKSAQNSAAAG